LHDKNAPGNIIPHPLPKTDMATELQINHNQQVTVLIAGRPYVLRVHPADEALVYRLAQAINEQITNLRQQLPERDVQDYLALALLSKAYEGHRTPHKPAGVPL
jgi:hypothetical protein